MRYADSQMVLGDDLHSKVVLQHIYPWVVLHSLHQSALDLRAGVIGVMQDAELRVTTLAVQIKMPLFVLIEVHAPLHQLLYLLRSTSYHLLNGCRITDPVAGYHRVVDMLVKIIHQQVGY